MRRLRAIFLFLDAVGLVVFTVIGCDVALGLDLPVVVVIASGMITGCAGGVLRDILCADVPLLFRAELYATVSVATGGLYLIERQLGIPHYVGTLVAMAAAWRFACSRFAWAGVCRNSSTRSRCTDSA